MIKSHDKFAALVLAADRGPGDPVAGAAGVPCKSLVPIGGVPMVLRVINALEAAGQVGEIKLSGPPATIVDQTPALERLIKSGKINWFANKATPSTSAFHVLEQLPAEVPVLLTTADHALLTPRMVDYFCREARAAGCDVLAGVARYETVAKAYPQTRRTTTRFQDGAYCGCNLFAFMTPTGRLAADFWRQVETQRKKPLRLIRMLGWPTVIRYLAGRLSLEDAMSGISRRMGFKAGAVIMPFAEAAVDVDSVSDLDLVEKIVAPKKN